MSEEIKIKQFKDILLEDRENLQYMNDLKSLYEEKVDNFKENPSYVKIANKVFKLEQELKKSQEAAQKEREKQEREDKERETKERLRQLQEEERRRAQEDAERLQELAALEKEAKKLIKQKTAIEQTDWIHYTVSETGVLKPKVHVDNTRLVLSRRGIVVKYNEMTKDYDITIPGYSFHPDTETNTKFFTIKNIVREEDLPVTDVDEHVQLIAESYSPVKDMIESKKWDGRDRIDDLCNTITSTNPIKNQLIRMWLIGAVAAVYEVEGVNSQGVLVLGGAQGRGKTTWGRKLVPEPDMFLEGAVLDPTNKDDVLDVVSHWIVELGEIGSTFKKDINRLKAFLTKSKDRVRPPYAAKVNQYARRTVFFGSVDEMEFLVDEAGSRRFWTIWIDDVDYNHNIDMQQVWAQVYELYRQGERYYMTRTEQQQLEKSNNRFKLIDPVHELLERYVRHPSNAKRGDEIIYENSTNLLLLCGKREPKKADTKSAGSWLRQNGFEYGAGEKTNFRRWAVAMNKSHVKLMLEKIEAFRQKQSNS